MTARCSANFFDLDRTALFQGFRCSGSHLDRIEAILTRDRRLRAFLDGLGKCVHLVDESLLIAVPHDLVSRAADRAVCIGELCGVRDIVAVERDALRAKDLDALVIAVDGAAAVVDRGNRAGLELERDDSCIDIAGLANLRVTRTEPCA